MINMTARRLLPVLPHSPPQVPLKTTQERKSAITIDRLATVEEKTSPLTRAHAHMFDETFTRDGPNAHAMEALP
jgi:hypothetical protein